MTLFPRRKDPATRILGRIEKLLDELAGGVVRMSDEAIAKRAAIKKLEDEHTHLQLNVTRAARLHQKIKELLDE